MADRGIYSSAISLAATIEPLQRRGVVRRVTGSIVEVSCPPVFIGEICHLHNSRLEKPLPCEVIGVRDNLAMLMPYDYSTDISVGTVVTTTGRGFELPVHRGWLGRVVDGLGRPIDGKGPLPHGPGQNVNRPAPSPLSRPRIHEAVSSGVRSIDCFTTWGKGQRLGVMAGSGVGKSTLFGMIARSADIDVNVIGLIGERGREVKEFIERDLGEEGLRRSVIVAVPSNESPLMRLKGSQVTMSIAEFFRDSGKDVLLMMDSLTRFAYAQRELSLSLGEPPTTRGYTPSVYAEIPRLCERAGIDENGSITALFTVLVEGDDHNEPVADIVRSVLDGHIVLSRKLATQGHYPPVDVLESVSRVMTDVVDDELMQAAAWARQVLAVHREAEDLINIGAYKSGNSPRIDNALENIEAVKEFLRQDLRESSSYNEAKSRLIALAAAGKQL
ncbi:FliI/YscN family ATPase [bacterium]|nr:FliI/YscN family ATPase [bacterium]UNM08654.1 MAG: FliI/YscN family ATPase [Planctomycetales bacterium]